ncbi:MAG: flagellar basal body-associated protein FliL [Steroidobacteraceae bacterium]
MAEAEANEAAPKKKSKALVWVLIAVVVLAGGAGGAFFFMNKGKAKVVEQAKPAPALYYKLDPAFVVNFEAEQLVRFLQVTIEVMSRDPHAVDFLKQHDPVIRNDLLLLLGNQQYTTISTVQGKEQLRKRALDAVRAVARREGGDPQKIEAVYFTSFVMQ